MDKKVYEIEKDLMDAIVNVLSQLPYQQVYQIINPLIDILKEQNKGE